jgi:hypothetical protein
MSFFVAAAAKMTGSKIIDCQATLNAILCGVVIADLQIHHKQH